jgi:hypothetical protein
MPSTHHVQWCQLYIEEEGTDVQNNENWTREEEEIGHGMKEGQRLNVLKAEKGQQYRRQGDSLTWNRGAMKSIHVERARLVEHIVKGAKHKISQQSYYSAPYDLSR